MPRKKTTPAAANKNALIAATIAELPDTNKAFGSAAREAWFAMARSAFDVAYGPVDRLVTPSVVGLPDPGRIAHEQPDDPRHFHVAPDGFAMAGGAAIDAADIPPGVILHDYRPAGEDAEFNPIMWKSGGSKKQTLPRGVVIVKADGAPPVAEVLG